MTIQVWFVNGTTETFSGDCIIEGEMLVIYANGHIIAGISLRNILYYRKMS